MDLLLAFVVALIRFAIADVIDENKKPTPVMITENRYPVQIHDITTEDGYNLQLHRIPSTAGTAPVVLVMHGFLGSSSDWVILGPGKALAYILADLGYDVWLGNARGNTYSKSTTNMTFSKKLHYWNFSWHEIGYYDLPAMIDFVLATTGQQELFYIGHSQGTTSFFVMTSARPKYNDKIIAMFAMAPIAYVNHATSILTKLISLTTLPLFYSLVDGFEFLPSSKLIALIGDGLCKDDVPTQGLCANAFMSLLGMSKGQLNDSLLPIIFGHFPAGASNRQLIHFGQLDHCGCFQWYDYDFIANLMVYKSPTPPKYDLSLITVPVYLYCGDKDQLSNGTDVDRLIAELPNPAEKIRISNSNWEHLDFVYGMDAKIEVYDLIIKTMQTNYGN